MPNMYSIILPSYNQPMHLARALYCLAALGFPRDYLEIIIVDDGGHVAVSDMADSYHRVLNIKVLRQPHGGPDLARRTGARFAQGQYIVTTSNNNSDMLGFRRLDTFLRKNLDIRQQIPTGAEIRLDGLEVRANPQFEPELLPNEPAHDETKAVVTVVIPTYKRPRLVLDAVNSVLRQTFQDFELIVVVDGRDQATVTSLSSLQDSRLRVLVPEKHLGNAQARNWGVQQARADWVAFLDDDDIWLPDKLVLQMRTAEQAACNYPVITCRTLIQSGSDRHLRPRRSLNYNEPVSEYLFCRRSPSYDLGQLQTSSLLARRSMLLEHPFDKEIEKHVDLDWVLRISRLEDCWIIFIPQLQPQVFRNLTPDHERISTHFDWQYSLNWLRERRNLVTSKAYSSFVLVNISAIAAKQGALLAFPTILSEALRNGWPTPVNLLAFVANMVRVTGPGDALLSRLLRLLRRRRR